MVNTLGMEGKPRMKTWGFLKTRYALKQGKVRFSNTLFGCGFSLDLHLQQLTPR